MKTTTTTTTTTGTGEKVANLIVHAFLTCLGTFVASTIVYTFFIILTDKI